MQALRGMSLYGKLFFAFCVVGMTGVAIVRFAPGGTLILGEWGGLVGLLVGFAAGALVTKAHYF